MSSSASSKAVLPLVLFIGAGAGILAWEAWRSATTSDGQDGTAAAAQVNAPAIPAPAPAPQASEAALALAAAETAPKPLGPGQRAGVSVDDVKRALENQLLSEQVSPSWAAHQEETVAQLLKAESLAVEGVEPPLYHSVECRSTLCRVDLVARNQADMSVTELHVLEGISETLGSAQLFHEPQADGTMALVIYASASKR